MSDSFIVTLVTLRRRCELRWVRRINLNRRDSYVERHSIMRLFWDCETDGSRQATCAFLHNGSSYCLHLDQKQVERRLKCKYSCTCTWLTWTFYDWKRFEISSVFFNFRSLLTGKYYTISHRVKYITLALYIIQTRHEHIRISTRVPQSQNPRVFPRWRSRIHKVTLKSPEIRVSQITHNPERGTKKSARFFRALLPHVSFTLVRRCAY